MFVPDLEFACHSVAYIQSTIASSFRLTQSVFIVASLQHMVLSHTEKLNTPLHFFQVLQPAHTRFVISISIPPSSSIIRLFETSNSFQFLPMHLYGLASRIPYSLCSKAKSVNLLFSKLTLTLPSLSLSISLSLLAMLSAYPDSLSHINFFTCTHWNLARNFNGFWNVCPRQLCYYIHEYEQARNQLSPQGGSFSTNIIPSKKLLIKRMNVIAP